MGSKRGQARTIGREYVCDTSKRDGLGEEPFCKVACLTTRVTQGSIWLVLGGLAWSVCNHTAEFVTGDVEQKLYTSLGVCC